MKLKICLLAALCFFFQAQAQQKIAFTGLQVGDKVPDITISNILYYPGGTVKISDFHNQLLILDFWATWCSSCISHFPEMYAIQNEFKADVFVLLVSQRKNRDTESGIKEFFKKRENLFRFPCAIRDTVLDKLFPHRTIPHYAIIKNNKVLAITDGETLTAKNIRLLISDNDTKLYVKRDLKINPALPLFTAGNGGEIPEKFYRSTLTGHISVGNSPFGFQYNKDGKVVKINAVNTPLPYLYIFSNPEYSKYSEKRMLVNIPEPDQNLPEFGNNHTFLQREYSYEAIMPPVSKSAALEIMRRDLESYFHLQIDTIIRDTMCLVLRLNKQHLPSLVKNEVRKETNISENLPIPKYSYGLPPFSLVNDLEWALGFPCFDETGYSEPVNVDLPADISDIKSLAFSLKKQGFILTREKRKVAYMVFSQLPNTPPNNP